MNTNQPRRDDAYLQRDSLDRGGAGDFRQFADGQGPAVSGGHVTVDAVQRPITQEERIGSVVSGSALSGATMGGIAGMGSGIGTTPTTTATTTTTGMPWQQQQQGVVDPKWDVPGASLGDRLKNAVVQTIHESQTGTVGNDMPPGHYQHATTHVNLGNTYGAASNPPDLLRDEDLESRNRDQQRKRTNFDLSSAGVVEIVPTDVPQSDMHTGRMGVPAKENYGGGVGVAQHDRLMGDQGTYSGTYSGTGYDSSQLHWTEKAAETIEDTKAKISETTHAAVNIAKAKITGHSDDSIPQK